MSNHHEDLWRRAGYSAIHAIAAALLLFSLQYFALNQSLESSLLWGGFFAAAAAALAWKQTAR
jgi:hypothetical protein